MKTTRLLMCLAPLMLAGCAVGPNYKRPEVAAPPQFRGATASDKAASLADAKWSGLFQDDSLQQLVTTALENNFDLAIASARVEQARAQFRITGADRYPFVSAQAQYTATRPSHIGSNRLAPAGSSLDSSYSQVGLPLSWELDFWGRLRRLTEAARAEYLASEEGRRGVRISLIADVTSGYLSLRELDLELEIAERTRAAAEDSLRLVKLRHDRGAATGLDVRQAEQLLYTATARIARAQRDIEQTENAISLLLGREPGAITRGKALEQFSLPAEVAPGLPSLLLERRPDVRQAEQALVAANARIGAAKALYFPQISLTAFLGGQSRALSDLLTGPARLQSITPQALLPVFNAGQVRAGVRFSEARKRELLANYQLSIYNGLREVSDTLVGYSRTREQRAQQQLLVGALEETERLSILRYKGGMDSYLQVLDAQRNLFQGQLSLAQLRLQEMLSYVQLYRALGGGWQ